jgi:hypothetical protein
MDFLASPLGVLLILGVVAVAAFSFQPAKYVGVWRNVAERYETERRPSSIAFPDEDVAFGVYEFTKIDAALDDEGFWMLYSGPDPHKAPACTLIPWDCIRFKEDKGSKHNFQVRLKKPVEFFVSPELGGALQRRSMQMPTGIE